jgi:uncharacterized protein (UPF0335 family)
MSCLEWCKFAQDCIGDEAYDRYQQNRAVGLRRKLLEALSEYSKQDSARLQEAEAILHWSGEILKEEKADWHIVIPASILQNVGVGSESGGFEALEQVLVRSGLMREDIEKIHRIVDEDPTESSPESDVVHDARLLADRGTQASVLDGLRTETAKRIAEVSSPRR